MNNFSIAGDFSNQFLSYHHFPMSEINKKLQKLNDVSLPQQPHNINKNIEETTNLVNIHKRLSGKIKKYMYVWVLNPQTDVRIIFSRAYASVTLFKFWHHFPKFNKTTKSSHLTTDGCLTKVTKT